MQKNTQNISPGILFMEDNLKWFMYFPTDPYRPLTTLSTVIIKARLKSQPIQQWTVGREYRRRIKKAFDEEGIEIPFPHRSIYVGEATKPMELLMKQGGDLS